MYCHPADSPIVTTGGGFRPLRVTPGVVELASSRSGLLDRDVSGSTWLESRMG